MTWGSLSQAPPFRVSADTTADLGDLVRASRLAQPANLKLLAQASQHMAALTSAVALRKGREEIQREAMTVAMWVLRLVEEGDATHSEDGGIS